MLTLDAVARAVAHFCFEAMVELLGLPRPVDPIREDTQFVFGRRLPDVIYRWCDESTELWLAVELQAGADATMPRRVGGALVQMARRALTAERIDEDVRALDVRVVEVRTRARSRRQRCQTELTMGGTTLGYEVSNVLVDDVAVATMLRELPDAPLRALCRSTTVELLAELVRDVERRWPTSEDPDARDYVLLLLGLVGRVRFGEEVVTMSTAREEAALAFAETRGKSYDEVIAYYERKQERERREADDRVRRQTLLRVAERSGADDETLTALRRIESTDELEEAVLALVSR